MELILFKKKRIINNKVDINDIDIQNKIIKKLRDKKFNLIDYKIDVHDYENYLNLANYLKYGNIYDATSFSEKSLEHYIASKLLNLSKKDIYIDIASSSSPVPEIYHELFGCTTYRQDLWYPPGIHGNTIGSDAVNMPIPDKFATKMGLHCSFEHFENDSDIGLLKEANRVLTKGGKLCILPLYLYDKYAIQTDFDVSNSEIKFEKDVIIYNAKGWGQKHGRFYDVQHLIKRIRNNLGNLKIDIYLVQNEKEISSNVYIKFVALFEKMR